MGPCSWPGLTVLTALTVAPRGGRACRTAQFPIPGNCGAVPPSSGAFESLPWVVTVQVEALADVHDPEDLLPCPSVPHPQGVVSGNSRSFKAPPTPDFFFGHLARVAVTHKLTSTCAGVAVTGRHILTAAHCLFAPRYKPTYTVLNRSHTTGMHKKESAGLPVATAVFHPGCSFHGTSRAVNDVAVLVLAEILPLSTICLPWPDLRVAGAVLWITRNEMHSSVAGHTILYPTRESVQLVNCSLLAHMAQDEEAPEGEDLCALSSGGLRDTGDPGAPLMVDTTQGWALVGLLSWLGDSQTLSTLAVFTDVRSLMPWLLETVFKTF